MQAPNWTDFLQCTVCTNRYNTTTLLPISLSCGHTICKKCLAEFMARVCPYDKTAISPNAELLPPNSALLWLLGGEEEEDEVKYFSQLNLSPEDLEYFKSSRSSIKSTAMFLQPLSEPGGSSVINYLTRPMLKKLVTVVNCQFLEPDGRARVLRAARSITDRTVTELLVMHQNQQQISTLLWSAIRSRGCQFLGPVMQEEALKLILKVLEGGAFLSRKNIVLYVVQQLQQQEFHQASKTCVGHVVQLLYRASCFNVEKRDEDSSRMRLKEEFRTYEALRREHDAQIIRVAMEGGLRISPEQWSALLYGDQKHKSDMQSIIDKLLSQGIATSGLSELIVAIRRSQDQHNLLEKIVPHLEKLLRVDINIDKTSPLVQQWKFFSESMAALVAMLHEYSSFMRIQSGRYKTGLCPNLTRPGGCPKGDKCTYAHTEEEREKYRHLARGAKNKSRDLGKPVSGPQSIPSRAGSGRWSGDIGIKLDSSPYSSLSTSYEGVGPTFPSSGSQNYSSGGSGFGVTDGYPDYSRLPTVGNAASVVLQPSLTVVGQPANLAPDSALPRHVISAQPQLVAYRGQHQSDPLTVSGEQLTVPHIDPAYFRRSGSIPEDYGVYSGSVVGVTGDTVHYSSTQPAAVHHDGYNIAPPPSDLESIKQVHADIKRNIQPCYVPGDRNQYPPSDMSQLQYPPNEGGQYENYPQTGDPRQLVNPHNYEPEAPSASEEQQNYHHDNSTGCPHGTVVATEQQQIPSSGSSGTVYSSDPVTSEPSRHGEEGVERVGEGVGKVEGGGEEGLAQQMSQLQLKEPAYYEAATYSTAGGGGGGVAQGVAYTTESQSQYPTSHSNKYPTVTTQDHEMLSTQQPQYSTVGGGQGGGGGEMEAMKEKIRQLEAQLAREKMKTTQQFSGPQTLQQSPVQTALYGNVTDIQGYPAPVQQYATRVQQVQMYPAASVQQPATAFYSAPTASSYQYANWSGPQPSSLQHYSGDLAGLPTVQPGSGYVLQQSQPQAPPAVGRSVYVQPQPVAPMQEVLNKDHMIAVYLQALEQSKVQRSPFTQPPLPSPYTQTQHHSTQAVGYGGGAPQAVGYGGGTPQAMGYGGGASLGYPAGNHYVPPSGTQFLMKPY